MFTVKLVVIYLQGSAIQHMDARKCGFAERLIGCAEKIGYRYRSLVYSGFRGQDLKKTYREGAMTLTVEHCLKRSFKILDIIVHGKDIERNRQIVPVPYCFIRYINGVRYVSR